MIKKITRKFFKWVFKAELNQLEIQIQKTNDATANYESQEKRIKNVLQNVLKNIDVSVDVHEHSPSWAVVSLQGQKTDYIKFIDLGNSEIRHIAEFLRRYERDANTNIKIDASPNISQFLRIPHKDNT